MYQQQELLNGSRRRKASSRNSCKWLELLEVIVINNVWMIHKMYITDTFTYFTYNRSKMSNYLGSEFLKYVEQVRTCRPYVFQILTVTPYILKFRIWDSCNNKTEESSVNIMVHPLMSRWPTQTSTSHVPIQKRRVPRDLKFSFLVTVIEDITLELSWILGRTYYNRKVIYVQLNRYQPRVFSFQIRVNIWHFRVICVR